MTELSKHSCRDEILQCNIKKILESDKTGHGYEHAIQTSEYAKTIIADEIIRFPDIQLDEDSIVIAALVHDIQRPFEKRNGDSHYGPVSLERIEELLLKSQFSKKEIKPILELVRVHDITSWEKLKTLSREAQILIDADNLGALGFSGIKRTIQYARNLNEILYDPQNTKTRSTIKHIEDYVLNLYKFLFTPKAKEIGKPLDKEVRLFINEFYQEYLENKPKEANYSMKVFKEYHLL